MKKNSGGACARCGACLPVCPVYRQTLIERHAPRGRLALLEAAEDGLATPALAESISACLQCGACSSVCSADARPHRKIAEARKTSAQFAPPWPVLWHVLGSPTAWSVLDLLGSLPAATGIFFRLGAMAMMEKEAGARIPDPAPVPLLSRRGLKQFQQLRRHRQALLARCPRPRFDGVRIAIFSGCVQNFIYPEIPAVMASWFPGAEFVIPSEQCCCGLPAMSAGAWEPAVRLAARNVQVLSEAGADVVLTGCASCAHMIRQWPEHLEGHAELYEKAGSIVKKTREFTEYVSETGSLLLEPAGSLVVTAHEPCHARYGQGGAVPVEKFLRNALPENYADSRQECCGHGGLFSIRHAEISDGIFRARLGHAEASGASVVATSCSGCLMQWRSRIAGKEIRVLHVSELAGLKEI